MNNEQKANLKKILDIIRNARVGPTGRSLTPEEAYIATWIAYAESRFRPDIRGTSQTESGLYQYINSRWRENFDRYGESLGFNTDQSNKEVYNAEVQRWMSMKYDIDLQTEVFVRDMARFEDNMQVNDGRGMNSDWDKGGPIGWMTAKEAMELYGIPWTAENYVYLRHNTDIRELKMVMFWRLLNSDYTEVEQTVESSYGQEFPDNYENPSLVPLIQGLASAMKIDISGMSNQEALEVIKARFNLYSKEGRDELLKCLSGYRPWDVSKLWKHDPYYRYNRWFTIEHAEESFTCAKSSQSPLILDLDGDGVETTNVADGTFFDHDKDGFAELTGWVGADDGLLVWDRNNDGIINDGKELFGSNTLLKNGSRAANGFEALAEWDDNHDGKIDVNDSIWSSLKVWQDFDGDGYSSPDELWNLADFGIASMSTGRRGISPRNLQHLT